MYDKVVFRWTISVCIYCPLWHAGSTSSWICYAVVPSKPECTRQLLGANPAVGRVPIDVRKKITTAGSALFKTPRLWSRTPQFFYLSHQCGQAWWVIRSTFFSIFAGAFTPSLSPFRHQVDLSRNKVYQTCWDLALPSRSHLRYLCVISCIIISPQCLIFMRLVFGD